MSRSLELSFQSASSKYSRLSKKVKKSIARGEFWRFTSRKRNHLLARIEKLRKRLLELRTQIKIASVGVAAAAILGITSAEAQTITTTGPFQFNALKNPIPPPAFSLMRWGDPQYRDFDGDGDLDAIVTRSNLGFQYYENVGDKTTARFLEDHYNYRFQFSLPGIPYSNAHAAYADLDDDGDLDVVAMASSYSYTPGTTTPISLYENTSNPGEGPYFSQPDIVSPFSSNAASNGGWPTFTDIDGDGDQDLVISGQYGIKFIQVFRNEKVGHEKGVWPTFKPIPDASNPIKFESEGDISYIGPSFADIDGDGDDDFIKSISYYDGAIQYSRNDNGTFVPQEGDFQYNESNPGASTGNPFNSFVLLNEDLGAIDSFKGLSFADLDGDGDLDATLAVNVNDETPQSSSFFYFENDGKGKFSRDASKGDIISGTRIGRNASSSLFDWDNDGDLDIVALNNTYVGSGCEQYCETYNRSIVPTVFLFNNGKYSPPTGISENPLPADIPSDNNTLSYFSDVDSDGDLDLVIWRAGDGYADYYYYEKTPSAWVKHSSKDGNNPFTFLEEEGNSNLPAFADLDNDGLIDLATVSGNDTPRFYKNTGKVGAPKFTYNEEWSDVDGYQFYYNNNPQLVDMDNDGDYDLISSNKYDNVWYYENQGDKTKPKYKLYTEDNGESDPQYWGRNPFATLNFYDIGNLNMADIDGDGDKDLLFVGLYDGTFSFYENTNPAPTVNAGNTTLQFTKNTAVKLSSNFTIADSDKDKIVKVTAKVTPYTVGQEKLQLSGTHGNLTAEWNNTLGELTITGSDTVTVWQSALRGIEYLFTGPTAGRTSKSDRIGKAIQKTVTVTTLDSDLTKAPSNTTTFSITGDDGTGPGAVKITPPHKTAIPGGNIAIIVRDVATTENGDLDLNSVIATSQQGSVTVQNGVVTIDYSGNAKFTGTDVVTLTVCDTSGECSTADIPVKIDSQIFVYTGMSPNGDTINDWFQVDFLPEGSQVAIYNRWGEIIYEEKNYSVDDPKRRFEGVNKNGTEVIAGSYFYKIKVKGSSDFKSGNLLISR